MPGPRHRPPPQRQRVDQPYPRATFMQIAIWIIIILIIAALVKYLLVDSNKK